MIHLDPQLLRVLDRLAEQPLDLPEDTDPDTDLPGVMRAIERVYVARRATASLFDRYDLTAQGREAMGIATVWDRMINFFRLVPRRSRQPIN